MFKVLNIKSFIKVLFLDIDGVLNVPAAELGYRYGLGLKIERYFKDEDNTPPFHRNTYTWCPSSLYNLYRIIEETGTKVVISSTWRRGKSLEHMKSWFKVDFLKDAVIGKTPIINEKQRGDEIAYWLSEHKEVTNFAVVDDDSDMDAVRKHFFKTDGFIGLDWRTADKVIKHLNKENKDDG